MIALTYSSAQILCHGKMENEPLLNVVSVQTCPCWGEKRLKFYGMKKN